MAFTKTKLSVLETMLDDLQKAALTLADTVKFMKEHGMTDAHLKSESRTAYAKSLRTFATESDNHVRDQYACSQNGQPPLWQQSKQKSEIDMNRRKAIAALESQGLIQPENPPRAIKKRAAQKPK